MRIAKPVRWIGGEIRTPPFTESGRIEAGALLRELQNGNHLSMPVSRPMPSIGAGCHELRVRDEAHNWRIIYYIGASEIVVLSLFAKQTQGTPAEIIEQCRREVTKYKRREGTEPG